MLSPTASCTISWEGPIDTYRLQFDRGATITVCDYLAVTSLTLVDESDTTVTPYVSGNTLGIQIVGAELPMQAVDGSGISSCIAWNTPNGGTYGAIVNPTYVKTSRMDKWSSMTVRLYDGGGNVYSLPANHRCTATIVFYRRVDGQTSASWV
jgi:hypothetical protein